MIPFQIQALVFLLALLSPSALGFTSPCQRNPKAAISISNRPTNDEFAIHKRSPSMPSSLLFAAANESSSVTRADVLSRVVSGSVAALIPWAPVANSFDGGVGGLGKTRPQTGVVFRDPEAAAETTQSSSGGVNYELVAPEGTPVFLSFSAPWPLLKSTAGIEARDIAGGESSYVQVVNLPKGVTSADGIKPALLSESIFGAQGKFGAYGAPTDIRIKKISQPEASGTVLYKATFTTLTPAMRESDRKAFISASVVGDGLFLLVTTTTAVRFGKLEGTLRKVADSFSAVSAPKTSLNQRKS